jgi:hypothetical protein
MACRWVRRVVEYDAHLTATAFRTRQGTAETSVVTRYDEVSPKHLNGLVEIDGSGVPAHRFRTRRLAVGSDGVAVLAEVAEGPVDGHFVAWRFSASSASIPMRICMSLGVKKG